MSTYDARLTTTRTTVDGLGREQSSTQVYDGNADVQEQEIRARTQDGTVIEIGQAQAYAPEPTPNGWFDQEDGDDTVITWPDGTTQAAVIARAPRRLDTRLVLSYE